MTSDSSGVAKVIVKVERGDTCCCLLARKNAPGHHKHNRLEFLGGHIENESPVEAIVRELKEEEKTGLLSAKLTGQQPAAQVEVDGQNHYIFQITISQDEYLSLEHDPSESLGFELVPISALREEKFQSRLTRKTGLILLALQQAGKSPW